MSQALGVQISAAPGAVEAVRAELQLTDSAPVEALDRVAAAFHGRWRPVYHIASAANLHPWGPAPFPTGRHVTLHLEAVDPRAVLMMLAQADGGILVDPPPVDAPRLDVNLDDVTVEAGMDRISADLGLSWTRGFELLPGTASVISLSAPADAVKNPETDLGRAPRPGASSLPTPQTLYPLGSSDAAAPGAARAGRPGDVAPALSDGLVRIMKMDPSLRRSAVRRFAGQMDTRLRALSALPPAERSQQRAQIERVYRSAMRLYQGLTPDQQQEFRPLFDVLRNWLNR